MTIAGDGPQRDELQALAHDQFSIDFLGYVSEEKKRTLLAKAEVFVLPATRNGYDVEGFGIVYLESQASGTPVVGSECGGAPEAVIDS